MPRRRGGRKRKLGVDREPNGQAQRRQIDGERMSYIDQQRAREDTEQRMKQVAMVRVRETGLDAKTAMRPEVVDQLGVYYRKKKIFERQFIAGNTYEEIYRLGARADALPSPYAKAGGIADYVDRGGLPPLPLPENMERDRRRVENLAQIDREVARVGAKHVLRLVVIEKHTTNDLGKLRLALDIVSRICHIPPGDDEKSDERANLVDPKAA